MTIERTIAIHEAGHAIAFLSRGRRVDAVLIRDNKTGLTIPGNDDSELPVISDAIITLAGPTAEEVAFEKGLITETISALSSSTFRRVPLEEIDGDESKYRRAIYVLQKERPGFSRKTIDKNVRSQTRALVEEHWDKIIEIADALESRAWITDAFPTGRKTKTLDGAEVEKLFNS